MMSRSTRQKPAFSVSLMCMDLMRAGEQIEALNQHADQYHLDIMDGHFAQNIALSPDFVKACAEHSSLPLEAHLMTEHPGDWIDVLAENGARTISLHAETVNRDAFRLLGRIRDHGCAAGIVLNPATPLSAVQHYLDRIDLLTVMTVDVGYAGQPFIREMLTKIEEAAERKRSSELGYTIQIDGSCNARTFGQLWGAGAEMFVLGSSGLFALDSDLHEAWRLMNDAFTAATAVVS